jgi:Multicopper oxidase
LSAGGSLFEVVAFFLGAQPLAVAISSSSIKRVAWIALLLAVCLACRDAAADRDEYTGLAWNPTSTPAHPCGVGLPPRGNFAHDRWVNARKPTVGLVVRQEGTTLCYVIDGAAEAPTIRVKQGAMLTVTVRNEITDPSALAKLFPPLVLRDHPVNAVPESAGVVAVIPGQAHVPTGRTNLHVHGFAVPPAAPQDEVLMGCADPAVGDAGCGHREITYHYQIPSDMPPGLYWYHPHVHGEVQAQMLAGFSGAIVVEGPDDRAREEGWHRGSGLYRAAVAGQRYEESRHFCDGTQRSDAHERYTDDGEARRVQCGGRCKDQRSWRADRHPA